jgi:hypothetical protein
MSPVVFVTQAVIELAPAPAASVMLTVATEAITAPPITAKPVLNHPLETTRPIMSISLALDKSGERAPLRSHEPLAVARTVLLYRSLGRLLVLGIAQQGLTDAFRAEGLPSLGAVIGVHRDGSRQVLASTGLEFPTGLAVGRWGSVYVSNYGVLPATGGPIRSCAAMPARHPAIHLLPLSLPPRRS